MSNYLVKVKEDFSVVTRRELIKTALYSAVAFTGYVTTTGLLSKWFIELGLYRYWIGALFAALAGLWYLRISQKRSRTTPSFGPVPADFTVVQKVISYQYNTITDIIYRKQVKLRALKHGLRAYTDKYHWTGSGLVEVSSADEEQTFTETSRENIWRFYEIRWPKTLHKNEEIQTNLVWNLKDIDKSAVPFVSADIEEPTDCLILSLELNPDLGVKQVTCDVRSSIGARSAIFSETRQLDDRGRIEWRIDKPKLLHHYEIKWVFPRTANEYQNDCAVSA